MSSTEIEVIHAPTEIEPYAVIVKPFGLPSAPLYEGDPSAYTQAAQLYPELNSVCGVKEVEHGLLHRIDTPTQGLLLIAARQDFYEYMQQVQKGGLFVKTYKALCDIIPDALEDTPEPPLSATEILGQVKENCEKACMGLEIKSKFRPFGKKSSQVRPVTQKSGKYALQKAGVREYTTRLSDIKKTPLGIISVECSITAGYRHQVRCHLAWLGLPVIGDTVYNPRYAVENKNSQTGFCFAATGISFPVPDGSTKSYRWEPEWNS